MSKFHPPSDESVTCDLYPCHAHIGAGNMPPEEALVGVCPVCGNETEFIDFSENMRESGRCVVCGSSNRQRQMAWMLRRRLYLPPIGKLVFREGFTIYNAESSGPLHARLAEHTDYMCSEYFGDGHQSGEIINGIRHEDLRQLSFGDAAFDLVLSSDVLEHMPSPYDAHRDIFRVLKPGGRHIFTVPFNAGAEADDVRARMVDGRIKYLAEPLYHGDPIRPDEGILVWTIFGTEMMQKLETIGFVASAWNLYEPESGIIGSGNIVFEARKPPVSGVVIGCPPMQQDEEHLLRDNAAHTMACCDP